MASPSELEQMSVEELGQWIVDKGFAEEVREAFSDQGMDGEEISLAFATTAGPDCLKEVISKYGLRLKVYRVIKDALSAQNEIRGDPSQSDSTIILSEHDDTDEPVSKRKRTFSPSTSVSSVIDDASSSSSSGSPRPKGAGVIPNPFPIPTFRKSTESNFKNKKLDDDDRKYVVRTLTTMLCTYVQSPSMSDCEVVAKSLVAVHPFLKQTQSWKIFIYTKAQNINRTTFKSKDKKPAKRVKYCDNSRHPYPSLSIACDDDVSHERHMKLLKQEIEKSKPSMEVARELMQRTFPRRRQWILDEEHLVTDICAEYPFLQKQSIVASEMDLILTSDKNTRDLFTENWNKWENAIIKYAAASKNKPAPLKHALRDVDGDSEKVTLTALRCLAFFLTTKSRKGQGQDTADMDVPFVLNESIRGAAIEESCTNMNHPLIIRYVDADDEILPHYIIVVEKKAMMQCQSLLGAMYTLFAIHYVFNMEYHTRVKDFYLFIQKNCFMIKDTTATSTNYANILSSLQCYLDCDSE